MFRTKAALLQTDKSAPVPGILVCHAPKLRFVPIEIKNQSRTSVLEFDLDDLLAPVTQFSKPQPNTIPSLGPGKAEHNQLQGQSPPLPRKRVPIYLQLRVKLLFGCQLTPADIASYWFMISIDSISHIYDTLHEATRDQSNALDDNADCYRKPKQTLRRIHSGCLLQMSKLLEPSTIDTIKHSLPIRLQSLDWKLSFSTFEHGFSLQNLYRTLAPTQALPTITVIRDTDGHVFGCYMSEAWKKMTTNAKSAFYGSGESFVFQSHPTVKLFPWAKSNKFFVASNDKHLMIGGGCGSAAIWLDDDLLHGCSSPCSTYNSEQLSKSKDFLVDSIEFWQIDVAA